VTTPPCGSPASSSAAAQARTSSRLPTSRAIEAGQRAGAVGVVPERELGPAALASQRHPHDLALLDELDRHPEAERALVPGTAAGHVADRQLEVMDALDHETPLSCS
jgi:hypothetical protein